MRALLVGLVLCALGAEAVQAQSEVPPPRVRVRYDAVVRWAPRYVLTAEEQPSGVDRLFWRRVEQLPLFQRLSLDGRHLVQGAVDVHISAWSATGLSLDADDSELSGDFAVAYARANHGAGSVWAGRRFVGWGPPGGLHVDGGGLELRTPFGLFGELLVGRPVTPQTDSVLGPQPSFDGHHVAYGALVGYRDPGKATASASYVERWAQGLATDRSLGLNAVVYPHKRLSAEASASLDAPNGALEQLDAAVIVRVARPLSLEARAAYFDPRRLLPAWSVLSVFATTRFHEQALAALVRLTSRVALRAEAGVRTHLLPQADADLGYRVEGRLRVLPSPSGTDFGATLSRRHNGVSGYTLGQARVGFVPYFGVRAGAEVSVAYTDGRDREALLGRLHLARAWQALEVGTQVGLARTPFAEAEARALLYASYREVWP